PLGASNESEVPRWRFPAKQPPRRRCRFLEGILNEESGIMKVAVVWNSGKNGVINRFGPSCRERYAKRHIEMVVAALEASGHTVACCEGDKMLLTELERFIPSCATTGRPTGMVFNMAYGIQGESRYTHVPAILEMAGIPYTGSGPLGHAL